MTTRPAWPPKKYSTGDFPDNHPSNHQPRPTGLDFSEQARTVCPFGVSPSHQQINRFNASQLVLGNQLAIYKAWWIWVRNHRRRQVQAVDRTGFAWTRIIGLQIQRPLMVVLLYDAMQWVQKCFSRHWWQLRQSWKDMGEKGTILKTKICNRLNGATKDNFVRYHFWKSKIYSLNFVYVYWEGLLDGKKR